MTQVMQRTMYATAGHIIGTKDGEKFEADDTFSGKLNLEQFMKAARRKYDTRTLMADPDSLQVFERTYKLPTDVFIQCCEAYENGTLDFNYE